MADLDAAFQREQLLLEVLLDIRDALAAPAAAAPASDPGPDPSPHSKPFADHQAALRISMSRRLAIAALCFALGCAPKADLVIVHGMVWTGLSPAGRNRASSPSAGTEFSPWATARRSPVS